MNRKQKILLASSAIAAAAGIAATAYFVTKEDRPTPAKAWDTFRQLIAGGATSGAATTVDACKKLCTDDLGCRACSFGIDPATNQPVCKLINDDPYAENKTTAAAWSSLYIKRDENVGESTWDTIICPTACGIVGTYRNHTCTPGSGGGKCPANTTIACMSTPACPVWDVVPNGWMPTTGLLSFEDVGSTQPSVSACSGLAVDPKYNMYMYDIVNSRCALSTATGATNIGYVSPTWSKRYGVRTTANSGRSPIPTDPNTSCKCGVPSFARTCTSGSCTGPGITTFECPPKTCAFDTFSGLTL